MNVVSGVSLALLIVCMFTCSFVVDRYVKHSHDDDNFPVLPSAIIFLSLFVYVVVAFINLEWGQPASWSAIVVFLAVANFMISLLISWFTVQGSALVNSKVRGSQNHRERVWNRYRQRARFP